jgi:hypothetical protein
MSTSTMYAYKNRNTGQVVLYGDKHPELEALDNWETVDPKDVDDKTMDAARLAYAAADTEQRLIAQAQAARQAARTAPDGDGVLDGSPPPTPTAGHTHIAGVGDQDRILDKSKGKGAAVQIGPNPENHPQTPAEVAALGAYQTENPPTDGVLARAKRDHKPTGRGKSGTDAGAAATQSVAEPAAPVTVGDSQPARTATKAELVAWAVAPKPPGGGMSHDDAMAMTRDALAEKFGR